MLKQFNIKDVHLSGYRTIKDLSIDLNPGLNVIIGKNGAGKTNFLKYLGAVLNFDLKGLFGINADYTWESSTDTEHISIKQLSKPTGNSNIITEPEFDISVSSQDGTSTNYKKPSELYRKYFGNRYFIADLLSHSVHVDELMLLTKPLSLEGDSDDFFFSVIELIADFSLPYFIKTWLIKLAMPKVQLHDEPSYRYWIVNALKNDALLSAVSNITPIKNFRIKDDFKVFISTENKSVKIENITIEFLLNDSWIPYSSLSDGTKRVFEMICDLACGDNYLVGKGVLGENETDINRVVLIEEPELGIHPHQLKKLMSFIKMESEKKQIIVSTHSPEILDVLAKDDLNRIILAEYDPVKGTQLRHLTDEERKKAKTFMDNEAFLSDYWKYSTLETR